MYGYILPTSANDKIPRAEYQNIRLVCRQVKEEFDHEMIKAIGKIIDTIAQSSSSREEGRLQIKKPQTYVESQHLEVDIPQGFWYDPERQGDASLPLFDLLTCLSHVHSISMHVPDYGGTEKRKARALWNFVDLIRILENLHCARLDAIATAANGRPNRDWRVETSGDGASSNRRETKFQRKKEFPIHMVHKRTKWRASAIHCLEESNRRTMIYMQRHVVDENGTRNGTYLREARRVSRTPMSVEHLSVREWLSTCSALDNSGLDRTQECDTVFHDGPATSLRDFNRIVQVQIE
jgi:hypothetical protein